MYTGSCADRPKHFLWSRTPDLVHSCRSLADLIERVLPIAGVRPDLALPATQFDGLGPRLADQHVQSLELVETAIPRPRIYDLLRRTDDAHDEGLTLDADDSVNARHTEQN